MSKTIETEMAGNAQITLYAVDDLANLKSYTIPYGKIDRTNPNPPTMLVTGEYIPDIAYQEVTMTSTGDTLGEVDYMEFSSDGGATWTSYAQKFDLGMFSGDVTGRVVDKAGNKSEEVTVLVVADSDPPTLEGFEVTFDKDPTVWRSDSVTATASGGFDAVSGIGGYEYSTDLGTTWHKSSSATLTDYTILWYRIYDKAQNRSDHVEYEVLVDGNAPNAPTITKGIGDDWVTANAILKLSDLGGAKALWGKSSGVENLQYSLDGGISWVSLKYSDTLEYDVLVTEAPKDYLFLARSVDKVGRISAVSTSIVKVDPSSPSIAFEYQGNNL